MKKVILLLPTILAAWCCAAVPLLAQPAAAPPAEPVAPVLQAEQERIAAIAGAIPTAVSIFSADGNGGGSGVVISADGYALTNFHVVAPCGDYMKCGMADGRLYDAVVVGVDPTGDVGLVKLFGREDFPVAEMADSDEVQVGDWCFAVGNPFLLATNLQPTISYGIVSGVHRYQFPAGTLLEYTDCIQTDAAINPGNSGGPLFNARGQLIGVNGRGSFEKRGRVNVGLGYAISINQIKHFLGHLRSGRIVDHATLGATVGEDENGRVVISNILDSSDAYRRGLRYDDELLEFGGRAITSPNAFKNVLGIYPNGWRVPLSYRRDGVRQDVYVRLAGVHSREELLELIQQTPRDNPDDKPKRPDDRQPRKDKDESPPEEPAPPGPNPHGSEKREVPAEFAAFIKARPGYANYYFNELNRTRVWNAFHDRCGDFADLTGDWTLIAEADGAGELTMTLGAESSRWQSAAGEATLSKDRDLSQQLAPSGSGGLLAALHLWRRLLVAGPERFGEVYYLGTAPTPGRETLCDVLVGTFDVAETNFVFAPEDGTLIALEMAPDTGVDPCELYFSDYADFAGRRLPQRIEVRHGDRVYLELKIREVRLPEVEKRET